MRILITGGAGYIAYSLVEKLLSKDPRFEIVLYDNLARKNHAIFFNPSLKNARIQFIQADILDSYNLSRALEDVDSVIHLAGEVSHPDHDMHSHRFEQVNHWGTAALIDHISGSSSVRNFIYLSSSTVYGDSTHSKSEEDAPHPLSAYASSKWRGEKQVHRLDAKVHSIILRSGNVYGYNPAMRTDTVVNRFMFQAQTKGRVLINGSGEQVRSFVHVDKLSHMIGACLDENVPSGTYNLSEYNLSVLEWIAHIRAFHPQLEYLNINQHLKMRNNILDRPAKIERYVSLPEKPLEIELKEFKEAFGF